MKGNTIMLRTKLLCLSLCLLAALCCLSTFTACAAEKADIFDPNRFADAVKYDELTHTEVLAKGLKVMDSTAASLCRDNNIPILVFNLNDPENIIRAAAGEKIGTLVK